MKALVLCNGVPPNKSLIEELLSNQNLFIAADGGGNVARQLGLTPEIVIGDLDSYKQKSGEDTQIIKDDDQETNDLEKALYYLVQHNYKVAVILGSTGFRLDHTLKNLSVLKQFNPLFEHIEIREKEGRTFLLPEKCELQEAKNTPISLFPLSGRVEGITTQGLMYPLDNEFLENGVRDGSSNIATGNTIHITHTKGDLLIYIADSSYKI